MGSKTGWVKATQAQPVRITTRTGNIKEHTMERIGKWIILGEAGRSADGHMLYRAECSKCGHVRTAKMSNIKRSAFYAECNHTTGIHWPSTRLSGIYQKMVRRCNNPNAKDYKFYGAKGVFVCFEWMNDRNKFIEWAMSHGYDDTMSIDRIDSNDGYCPDNCRWIPMADNSKYKSTTRTLTIHGVTDSLSGWAKRLCIPKNTLVANVRGKTDEEAVEFLKSQAIGL